MDWVRDDIRATDDPTELDIELVQRFLSDEAYWSRGIPRAIVERAIANSLVVGAYDGADQVGFARVVTDRATFAYLCDVFVVPSHRGRGIGRWLSELAVTHPDLRDVRRHLLATRDAHGMYEPLGFRPLSDPAIFLEITRDPDELYRPDAPRRDRR